MPYSEIVVFSEAQTGRTIGWSDKAAFAEHEDHVRPDVVVEHFAVRISDQGVAEWLREREALRRQGFPDRPPDVDTPDTRTWIRHPGEVGEYFDEQDDSAFEKEGAFFVMSFGRRFVNDEKIRMFVAGLSDGSYMWSMSVETASGHVAVDQHYRSDPTAPEEDVWEALEVMLAFIAEFDEEDRTEPILTTYSEGQFVESEIALAKADIARGFISPLGEARA